MITIFDFELVILRFTIDDWRFAVDYDLLLITIRDLRFAISSNLLQTCQQLETNNKNISCEIRTGVSVVFWPYHNCFIDRPSSRLGMVVRNASSVCVICQHVLTTQRLRCR